MSIKCPANEQVKRIYLYYLEHADGKAEATIKQTVMALSRFEDFTCHADFRTFNQIQNVQSKAGGRLQGIYGASRSCACDNSLDGQAGHAVSSLAIYAAGLQVEG